MAGFIFGGNTNQTYEQVQRQRQIADAMMAQQGTPRNVGEGISSFARQISGALIGRRAAKRDEELRSQSNEMFQSLFGGGTPSPQPAALTPQPASAPSVSTSPIPTPEQEVGADTREMLIRTGLVDRGLPEHVADAFVMNFRDESNLDPGINEIEPLVPGSRGGFGLAQWTGPRRRQLEAFAAERGTPVSDLNTQLDFLMTELEGPEARAAQSILSSRDAPTAAAAIVNDFLRPAEVNRAKREAQYLGAQPAATPQQGGQPSMQQIVAALSDPYIRQNPGQMAVLQSLLQQNMQASDPMRALEMERAQLELEALRNPQANLEIRELADGFSYYVDPTGNLPPRRVSEDIEPPRNEDAPTTKLVTLDDGSEVMVQWNPEARVWDPAPIPEGGTTGQGASAELTENQSKLTLFQSQQQETAPILLELEEKYNPANMADAAARNTPIAGNFLRTAEGQQYTASAAVWSEGALRIATGAAATQPEIDRTIRTYFAQPGDLPETVMFKARLREMYNRSIQRALGRTDVEGELKLPTPDEFAKEVAESPSEATGGADTSAMTPEELVDYYASGGN